MTSFKRQSSFLFLQKGLDSGCQMTGVSFISTSKASASKTFDSMFEHFSSTIGFLYLSKGLDSGCQEYKT